MTTSSQRHPLSTRTKRSRTNGIHRSARVPQRSHGGPEEPMVMPVTGPANHAPGVPIMGVRSRSPHAVMGGPDAARYLSVMGSGDQGERTDVFGDSEPRLVDSLFAPRSR